MSFNHGSWLSQRERKRERRWQGRSRNEREEGIKLAKKNIKIYIYISFSTLPCSYSELVSIPCLVAKKFNFSTVNIFSMLLCVLVAKISNLAF